MTSSRNRQRKSAAQPALMGILFILMFGLFCVTLRFIWIQVVDAPALAEAAESQRLREIETPAQRGNIYDREGQPLATSVQVYNIIADPSLITYKRTISNLLARYTGGDSALYYASLSRDSRYAIVDKKIEPQVILSIKKFASRQDTDNEQTAKLKSEIRSLFYELDYKRVYPANAVGGQVVGFVGGAGVGAAGMEMEYEEMLRGTPGIAFSERDTRNNPIPAGLQCEIDPVSGKDIMLTIDKDIQYVAQRELAVAVKAHKAKSGSVIVMDPRNGEVYAAASYPSFNPNVYNKASQDAIRNRALVDLYEPGSTLKCVTAAGAIESGKVTPTTTFSVPYSIKVGPHTIRDSHGHATKNMTFSQIIEESSNVGTTKAAFKMGKENLYKTLVNFGLADKPGMDFPGASHGWVPQTDSWVTVSLSNFSFGQGVSMTPILLTRAVAAIGMKGSLVTPHLLKDIPSDPANVPAWKTNQAVSPESATTVNEILKRVMTQGTGKEIKVKGYTVAGKTGTAQKAIQGQGYVKGKFVGSFIGYLPADKPELVVFVALDEPTKGYYGGFVAGPCFSNVAQFAASHLDIAPDSEIKVLDEPAEKGVDLVSSEGE